MLTIPRSMADEMVANALQEDPNECCGLLAGKGGAVVKHYRMTNTEHSPYRYNIDPRELLAAMREMDDNGWELMVIYHSHTHSPAYPSQTDVRMATYPDPPTDIRRAMFPDTYYVLISLVDKAKPLMRAFHILDGGQIVEEQLTITE